MYDFSIADQGNPLHRAPAAQLRKIVGHLTALAASPIFRTLAPILILGLFYWALFVNPTSVRGSSLSPDEARALVDRSQKLLRDAKYEQALEPTLKLYRAYPDSHIYADQAARIFHQLRRYQEEAELWEEFRVNAPRPEEACPHIGQAYEKLGSSKEAIAAYEWCLGLEPTNSDAVFYLAHALERDGQFDRAEELYRRGLAIAPTYSDLAIGLARVLVHQDKPAEAKVVLAGVLQRQPKNSDALFAMGMLYFRQQDLPQARRYLEAGAAQADSDVEFQIALARVAEKQNDLPNAILHYNRAVELSPDDKELRARRDSLVARR